MTEVDSRLLERQCHACLVGHGLGLASAYATGMRSACADGMASACMCGGCAACGAVMVVGSDEAKAIGMVRGMAIACCMVLCNRASGAGADGMVRGHQPSRRRCLLRGGGAVAVDDGRAGHGVTG